MGNPENSVASEGIRTYKRRKRIRLNSEKGNYDHRGENENGLFLLHKGREEIRDLVESVSNSTHKISEVDAFSKTELQNGRHDVQEHVESTGNRRELENGFSGSYFSVHCSNDDSLRQSRSFVLETIYHSLSENEGGIRGCISHALLLSDKEHGFLQDKDKQDGPFCNGSSGESYCQTVTEICRQAFLNIILSDQFNTLCKLLFDNLHEMKLENLVGLGIVNSRMDEAAYKSSHVLFNADIDNLQEKLQSFGTKLISLAKSLSDVSGTCLKEKLLSSKHLTSLNGNLEVGLLEFDSHYGSEQPEPEESCRIDKAFCCGHCGSNTDERNRLVCDNCEEIYHIFCVEHPIIEEVTFENWYCASCSAKGMGSSS